MFGNTKRIKALEQEVHRLRLDVEDIKSELAGVKGVVDALVEAISMHGELDWLKGMTKELIAFDNMISLDQEAFDWFLDGLDDEKKEFYSRLKNNYEMRLKRFIRSSLARRKPKTNTDGKEDPKATE